LRNVKAGFGHAGALGKNLNVVPPRDARQQCRQRVSGARPRPILQFGNSLLPNCKVLVADSKFSVVAIFIPF
jgi:hypothetical protein